MERFIHLWCGLLYCITYANIYSIQLIVHSCTRYRCISEAITWIHLQAIPALSRSLRLIIANKYIIIQILWYSNSCANCVQPSFSKNKKKKKTREHRSKNIYYLFQDWFFSFPQTLLASSQKFPVTCHYANTFWNSKFNFSEKFKDKKENSRMLILIFTKIE